MITTKKLGIHWPYYWPGKLTKKQQKQQGEYGDDLYLKVHDETLHIGQSYEDEAAKVIQCRICGGQEFNVGQGDCFTAIRCIKCQWEVSIHEG